MSLLYNDSGINFLSFERKHVLHLESQHKYYLGTPEGPDMNTLQETGSRIQSADVAWTGDNLQDIPRTVTRLRLVGESIKELKRLFQECPGPSGPPQDKVDAALEGLKASLQPLRDRYPSMGHPPVSHALFVLCDSLRDVKSQNRAPETKRYSEIFRDFDKLELSLVNAAADELLPDLDAQSTTETETTESTEQEDLMSEEGFSSEFRADEDQKEGPFTAQDADTALSHCEGGVELALQYAKMWCRYAKDLLNWMDKRFSLEHEFAKNIAKVAETAKSSVSQQDMMPLHSIYALALEHDVKSSVMARQTMDLLQQRCFQALVAKKNEIDRWRREFKDQWAKEQKKMNEAVTALKKAKQQYIQRYEELEKAKAMSSKAEEEVSGNKTIDKRRKSRDEAQIKMKEAEGIYKQCVDDANCHQEELKKVKEKIIVHIRKLIFQGDTVLKEATVNMFFYQRQQTDYVPKGYLELEQTCRPCEPGEPFLHFVQLRHSRRQQPCKIFSFQEFVPQNKRSPPSGHRKTSNPLNTTQDYYHLPDEMLDKRPSNLGKTGYSDSESIGGSQESLTSPAHGYRRIPKATSTCTVSSDDLDEKDFGTLVEGEPAEEGNGTPGAVCKIRTPSRAVQTHRLRKMKSKMSKCKQCDNYILVNGIECEECGLALHRKCLDVCQVECEHWKGSLFGLDFSSLLRDSPEEEVPFLVQRCTAEIEARALTVQGVYRVSGSKPRIQKLCQAFETQKDQIDLSDLSPHDITSVLKHFFKELPEPLLTFDLYNDFIVVGKDINRLIEKDTTAESPGTVENIVHSLRELLGKLPRYNYSTLHHMITHLYRISEQEEENKMSPANLGIVFGPTLLRPLVSSDMSMITLLETSYQALLVEFLITHCDQIFSSEQRACSSPPLNSAALSKTHTRAASSPIQENSAHQDTKALSQERPRSLESHTIKRDSSEGYISDKSSSNEAVDQLSPETNERAVLAVSGAASPSPVNQTEDVEMTLMNQPRGHFSRQPVKHPRQSTTAFHLQTSALRMAQGDREERSGSRDRWECGQPGSADSSRSSSPEPGILRHSRRRFEITPETARLLSKARCTLSFQTSSQTHPLPTKQEAGQDTSNDALDLSEEVETKEKGNCLAKMNRNQSNNRRVDRVEGLSRQYKRHLGHDRTAQKILLGLNLKRCDSGSGEQIHFV